MEFKVGDTIGVEDKKLLKAHLVSDQKELGVDATNCTNAAAQEAWEDDIKECIADIQKSLDAGHIRNEYTGDVLLSMNEKLDTQRELCESQGIPKFAPAVCWSCGASWTSSTLTGKSHITGCPHCHRTWCD